VKWEVVGWWWALNASQRTGDDPYASKESRVEDLVVVGSLLLSVEEGMKS
jgi:hypothetical protein